MNSSAIISTDQALRLINEVDAIVLDATIDKVNEKIDKSNLELLPNSLFLDIEGEFSDHNTALPHTVLSDHDFTIAAQKLGINQDSTIIVYDRWGIYSSPRAWWMFRYMGLESVYVLNGGLPAWKAAGLPIVHEYAEPGDHGNFIAQTQLNWIIDKSEILQRLDDPMLQIFDARSAGRFNGTAPEPREGMRSGHIPGSKNIPFDMVLDEGHLKEKEELEKLFDNKTSLGKENAFSCGSGITASIIGLAAYELGKNPIRIYDGSWSDWGSDPLTPIDK